MRLRTRIALLDRYLLAQMGPPMAAAFAVVLIALMLYRTLEIFNLLAGSSGQFGLVARLIGGLLPHYLGLALPAGYFISVFLVITRLSATSELDALLASGLSMERLARPFFAAGAVVGVASMVLLGYLQPYGRYDYNLGLAEALGSGWDARLQPQTFLVAGDGLVLRADRTDPTGRRLGGVFVRRIDGDGREQIFTAREGSLVLLDEGREVRLTLLDGQQLQERAGGPVAGRFGTFVLEAPTAARLEAFRARGQAARELTWPELVERMRGGTEDLRRRAASEFHTRLVRSVSPLLLPLLAFPLGVAAKRTRRGTGFIVAAVILLLYEHGIDMAQALADQGLVAPGPAVWTPFVAFAGVCAALYLTSRNRLGDAPFNNFLQALGDGVEAAIGRFRRRPARAEARP